MGRAYSYLAMLIFADLFFIATGQLTGSFGSILFNSLLNIENLMSSQFFTAFAGNAGDLLSSSVGIASIFGGGAVLIGGFIASKEFRVLLIPVFASLALLASDFIVLAEYLINLNPLMGVIVMGPISILFIFTAAEWIIGKD